MQYWLAGGTRTATNGTWGSRDATLRNVSSSSWDWREKNDVTSSDRFISMSLAPESNYPTQFGFSFVPAVARQAVRWACL